MNDRPVSPDADSGAQSKRRGRIPQEDWASIVQRYRTGATLASIAKDYGCTPSAIAYVVKKAEEAGVDPVLGDDDAAAAAPEAAAAEPVPAVEPAAETEPPAERTEAMQTETKERPVLRAALGGDSAPAATPAAAPTAPPTAAPAPAPAAAAPAAAPRAKLNLGSLSAGSSTPATPAAAAEPRSAAPAAAAPTGPSRAADLAEDTLVRFDDATGTLRAALVSFRGKPDETTLEALSQALHEMRRVAARVEIDMSMVRREEQALRPLPIPPHRSSRPRQGETQG